MSEVVCLSECGCDAVIKDAYCEICVSHTIIAVQPFVFFMKRFTRRVLHTTKPPSAQLEFI